MADYSDQSLDYIEQRIRDTENEISALSLDIEFSKGLASLHDHPGWRALLTTLQPILEGEMQKLVSSRMDAYQLGMRQSRIRTLRSILDAKPLDPQEVDTRVGAISLLRERLAEDRSLLR